MNQIFTKPVKYIFIGLPNCGKSYLAKVSKFSVFETDGLKKDYIYDLNKFDLSVDIIIIGGRFYKKWYQKWYILYKLKNVLCKKYTLLILRFNKI